MTKILIDENLSEYMAEGLDKLQAPNNDGVEVTSIIKEFYRGIADEEWIPAWGKKDGVFITQDIKITRRKNQILLLMNNKLGAFFLNVPNNFKYWDKVRVIVRFWPDIIAVVKSSKRPFAYEITPRAGVKKMSI